MNSPSVSTGLETDTVEMSLGDTQEFTRPTPYPRLVNPPQNILLGGLQGAGKGTNSKRFEKRENIGTYVSSDEMRKHRTFPELDFDMKNGVLVPNERVMIIVREYLETRKRLADVLVNGSKDEAELQIFDGMPRTMGQKEDFDNLLKEFGRDPAWAVKLELDSDPKVADEIARASVRFRVRRDAANGAARSDDTNPSTVERRIKGFHNDTEPLFEKYGEEGRLIVIDAKPSFDYDTLDINDNETFHRSAEQIYARLVHALNNRNG